MGLLRIDLAFWISRYWFFENEWERDKDFAPINTPWSKKHTNYFEEWDRDYFFCTMSFCSVIDTFNFSMSEILENISKIEYKFKTSKPWDDDCYWMAKSPFNYKYYVFAGQSAPYHRPFFVLNSAPPDWDE